MKFRQVLSFLVLAPALAACATQPANYRADAYQDGSYYSPGDDGVGDYYYAPEPSDDYYPWPAVHYGYSYGYGLGWPSYAFAGYCSLRYRYCPSWFGFGYPFGYGWYEPFRGAHHRPIRRDPGHHRHPRIDTGQLSPGVGAPSDDIQPPPTAREERRLAEPRERELPRQREPRAARPVRQRFEVEQDE